MKKIKLLSMILLIVAMVSGCGSEAVPENGEADSKEKISIICSIFPQYDWLRELTKGAEGIELTLLMDNGIDFHSYQPSAIDIANIQSSDMFVYIGGESEVWVNDVTGSVTKLSLLDMLGDRARLEELKEGMQPDEAHNHGGTEHLHEEEGHEAEEHLHEEEGHEAEEHLHEEEGHEAEEHLHEEEGHEAEEHLHEEEGHEDEEHLHEEEGHEAEEHNHDEPLKDEHVWLSLENAKELVAAITDELSKKDPEQKDIYEKNRDAYIADLENMNKSYKATIEESEKKVLVFGDRFPFLYMMKDYGLDYYAAFPGCSAETEANFDTVIFLSGIVDKHKLNNVLVLEGSDQKLAATIIENSNNKEAGIVSVNSMQGIKKEQLEGASYLGIMEDNLRVIGEALK